MGYPTLLDWDTVQHKLPWNIVILLGSGFAIADGAEVSGLINWYIGLLVYWSIGILVYWYVDLLVRWFWFSCYVGSGFLAVEIWLILLDW